MDDVSAIDGSCAVRPAGVPEGSQCVMADWGPNGYPAHWVFTPPEVPQTDDENDPPKDDGCSSCGPRMSTKQKASYGPLYTTKTQPLDGGAPSYGFGFQAPGSFGMSTPQMCTTSGDSPGITSTVSGSAFGSSIASRQSLSAPFDDSAHSIETCTSIPDTRPFSKPSVSVGFGGFR